MLRINKFLIGIRPASRMFRVPSVVGLIIDAILAERGEKVLNDEYYTEVASNHDKSNYSLRNEEQGNILRIDLENVIFIKDYYSSKKQFNFKKVINEFSYIWKTINYYLKLKDVRRIGIVAEHQFEIDSQNVNEKLLHLLTNFDGFDLKHPAKFMLRFENRHPTKEGLAPDVDKSDFINVIYSIYDGELDQEHPAKKRINVNIDVQRYFSPLLTSNIPDEVMKLNGVLKKEKSKFEMFLKDRGIIV